MPTIYPKPYVEEITITDTPSVIDVKGIDINAHECFKNAYKVSQKNPEVAIVEGVILLLSNDNQGTFIAHVWSNYKGEYFDITKEVVLGDHPDVKSVHYFPGLESAINEFEDATEWNFDSETTGTVEMLNNMIPDNTEDGLAK